MHICLKITLENRNHSDGYVIGGELSPDWNHLEKKSKSLEITGKSFRVKLYYSYM